MANIIAIANQKGGVGKTTTCVNLTAALARLSARVLLIDADPQGNATTACGFDKHQIHPTLVEVLIDNTPALHATHKSPHGFDVLPGHDDLTAAEVSLLGHEKREFKLLQALTPIRSNYDFMLIDCPPSLNMLTVNALVAANQVLVPMQCEYYALEGLSALMRTITHLQQTANPHLKLAGILATLFDGRNRLANDVLAQLKMHFPDQVYPHPIPRNVRLAEAPSHGLPGILYDPQSNGAQAYCEVAQHLWDVHLTQKQHALTATEK